MLKSFEQIDRSEGCDNDDDTTHTSGKTRVTYKLLLVFNKRGKSLCTSALFKEIWIGPYNLYSV